MKPKRPDTEQLEQAFDCYYPAIFRYFRYRGADADTANDLASATFEHALENLHRFDPRRAQIQTWLFAIVRRRAVDFYRQRQPGPLENPPSPEPGLLAAIEKTDDLEWLARLLAQLDDHKQELLRLRYSAGLRFAEIELLEGRSEAAVKMEVYRVLDFLREHWEAENG